MRRLGITNYNSKKPYLKYRFKDSMGCVFYKAFHTDREARLWYERNKLEYSIKEFGNVGTTYKSWI